MSEFQGISYRYGTVVDAVDIEGAKIPVEAGQARLVASQIKHGSQTYFQAIHDAIAAGLQRAAAEGNPIAPHWLTHLEDFPPDAEIIVSLAPSYVVDFPPVQCNFPECPVTFRSCLTICSNDASSKVWTRTVSSERVSITNPTTVKWFRHAAELVGASVLEVLRGPYAAALETILERPTRLTPGKRLLVLAADSRQLSDKLSQIYVDAEWDPDTPPDISTSPLTEAMRLVTGATGITELQDTTPDDTDHFQISAAAEIITYSSKAGVPSLFLAYENDDVAVIAGLAGVSHSDTVTTGNYPQGVGLTAEIAAQIGAQF